MFFSGFCGDVEPDHDCPQQVLYNAYLAGTILLQMHCVQRALFLRQAWQ